MVNKKVYCLFSNCVRHLNTELPNYVPRHLPLLSSDIKLLQDFIASSKNILILTGAGISTESGIPDYRSEGVGLYARTNHRPIEYQEFVNSASVRQRYWARNFIGWDRFSQCQPNDSHKSVRNLEVIHNKVSVVVTQNVDGLHYKAGSRKVIELHGTSFTVICLGCKEVFNRHDIQKQLMDSNPGMSETSQMIRPDGDVQIPEHKIKYFQPPLCWKCRGILKPDIVFFGDIVPRSRVELVSKCVSESDSVLVLGSSLTVFSGYRIILQAEEENKKIAIVNIGPTRADKHVNLRISAKCGEILPNIC